MTTRRNDPTQSPPPPFNGQPIIGSQTTAQLDAPPGNSDPHDHPPPANDNSPFPDGAKPGGPDDTDLRLATLMERIKRAERLEKPFCLRTAEEIYLYLDMQKPREVFNLKDSRLPFHREGSKICLYLDAYWRFVRLQQWCSVNGIDFDKRAREWGFPKPSELVTRDGA